MVIVLNRGSGSSQDGTAERLRELFQRHDLTPTVVAVAPGGLEQACAAAASDPACDIVVAAGGDGTVGALAGAVTETQRPLGIVPLGTLNHFARDAGIPTNIAKAVRAIAAGRTRLVDLAEVNGRTFVNNSAVGLYPEMVRFRDETPVRTRRGRRLAMLGASLKALRSFRKRRLWISAEGLDRPLRTPLLFVGNNRYRVNLLSPGRREALDRGELCIYAMRVRSRLHFLWAATRSIFGRLDQQRDFVTAYVAEAEISSSKSMLTLSLDGETLTMATPLRYRTRPGALKLIVPAPSAR